MQETEETLQASIVEIDHQIEYTRDRIAELQHDLNELYSDRYYFEQRMIDMGYEPSLPF